MNYYEQPVAQTFMDTYAPLPFQELAMLGTAYKKERDTTEAAIDEFKSQYGDFTSMSQADTQAWDRETMGKLHPSLLQMAGDPEKIKSQEFQSQIRSAIRSVDSSKLGMLKQSAENLKQRASVVGQLTAQGKYKKSWDNIDIANWDTLNGKGIMTDLAPLEYQSLHDIASPYSQALKDQYLGKIDRYRYWKGVDENQIRQSLSNASTDIYNTPQGQAWYKDIASELATQGITDPNVVKEEVMNRLVQSQKDYMRKNMEYDDAALKEDEMALRSRIAAAKQTGKEQPAQAARYTDQIRLDGKRFLNQVTAKAPMSNAGNKELLKAGMDLRIATVKGNPTEIAKAQANYDNTQSVLSKPSLDAAVKNNFEYAIGRPIQGSVNYKELVKGSKSVIDMLSSNNPTGGAVSILEEIATVVPKENGTKSYLLHDSRYLQNPTTVVTSMGGLGLRKHSNDFDKLLQSGAFKNVKVDPVTVKGLFNYTDKDGNFKQKQRVIVTVKEDDIDFDSSELGKLGKDRSKLRGILLANGARVKDVTDGTTTDSESSEIDSNGWKIPKKSTTTAVVKDKNRYITFEAFIDVPDDISGNQGTMVSNINARFNRSNMTSKMASELYPTEQADAFYGNVDLDDILSE